MEADGGLSRDGQSLLGTTMSPNPNIAMSPLSPLLQNFDDGSARCLDRELQETGRRMRVRIFSMPRLAHGCGAAKHGTLSE